MNFHDGGRQASLHTVTPIYCTALSLSLSMACLDAASFFSAVTVRHGGSYGALPARCHQSYFARYTRADPSVSLTAWGWGGRAEPRRCSHVAGSWAPGERKLMAMPRATYVAPR